ncbi:Panacea domain-containing protein [Rhizobium sp. RU20A]|uniref:Panacea domain-containing protein n=1 Tax=Rhizobium sp. RU20A TaxID=1907412 RepID=UPI00165EDEEA|nr:Panacea domain-containing protein [Rhizobium sp. RU20A]
MDLHTALKSCYFADRTHLNTCGRPIFGATYRAMKFGPVPVEIYEMMKGEALWKAELGLERFPWELTGYRLRRTSNTQPDLDDLSESDIEHLANGFERSRQLTFSERTEATHGDDWQKANLGLMRYEDMLEETPQKMRIVEQLSANGRYMRL